MIATDRGRTSVGALGTLVAAGLLIAPSGASAQLGRAAKPAAPAAKGQAPAQPTGPTVLDPNKTRLHLRDGEPGFKETAVPVNPTDAIAVVNGKIITRAQLADEAVARSGDQILEAMIVRTVIDQELARRKLDVTASEIDAEIDRVAMQMAGVSRETWLRTLDKERKISPIQYARDIIYPQIALRKLAEGKVTVTEQDLKDAMEANYGAKLHCAIIMADRQRTAIEIFEQLRTNPGGFEKIARERSTDKATAALGGHLSEPISRHAHPRSVSDNAFEQLVDGDPKDTDPTHKPKDGDISGPIQVSDVAWVIIRRESVVPAKKYDASDPSLRAMLHQQMHSVKVEEAMKDVLVNLTRAAEIDNRLTGTVKVAHEEDQPASKIDGEVKLMSNPESNTAPGRASSGPVSAPTTAPMRSSSAPTGLPADVANQADRVQKSIAGPK